MSTVIYLSNQDVRAVIGKKSGKNITVSAVYSGQAPEGSIINGQITQEEVFDEFLREFWEENHLPKKDVTLVVGTGRSVAKVIECPKMNYSKLMEYIPREFASVERTKDPAYSYLEMDPINDKQRVFAAMVERSFLSRHLDRFKAMGVTVDSISIGIMSDLRFLNMLHRASRKTCVVQFLDGITLYNILFVDGQYMNFTTNRIFGERGTPVFGIETARAINTMTQFLRTQNADAEITDIFLAAGFHESDLEICRESILQMNDTLEVNMLRPASEFGHLQMAPGLEDDAQSHYFTEIAGLLIPKDKTNLKYQLTHSPEILRRRREMIKYTAPAAVLTLVFLIMALVQAAKWFSLMEQANEQMDYISNPVIMEHIAQYNRLNAQNTELDSRLTVIEDTWHNIQTYPVYTTEVREIIEECGAGLVTVNVNSFDAESGRIMVEGYAPDSNNVHQFVNRLENRDDIFEEVYYDGFVWNEGSGVWRTSVNCYMKENVPEEENMNEEVAP